MTKVEAVVAAIDARSTKKSSLEQVEATLERTKALLGEIMHNGRVDFYTDRTSLLPPNIRLLEAIALGWEAYERFQEANVKSKASPRGGLFA